METEQEALEGVVSKQQVTALGGTVRVWLPSSTQGTEGAGNAMGWEEKGDPIPCSPWQGWHANSWEAASRKEALAWYYINPWTC